MGWKSVEMQVAIPRTQDASNLQDQMAKQHQRFQDSLAQHQLREQLEKRRQVNEYNEAEKLTNGPDQDGSNAHQKNQAETLNDEKCEEEGIDHPYKGKRFDLTR